MTLPCMLLFEMTSVSNRLPGLCQASVALCLSPSAETTHRQSLTILTRVTSPRTTRLGSPARPDFIAAVGPRGYWIPEQPMQRCGNSHPSTQHSEWFWIVDIVGWVQGPIHIIHILEGICGRDGTEDAVGCRVRSGAIPSMTQPHRSLA